MIALEQSWLLLHHPCSTKRNTSHVTHDFAQIKQVLHPLIKFRGLKIVCVHTHICKYYLNTCWARIIFSHFAKKMLLFNILKNDLAGKTQMNIERSEEVIKLQIPYSLCLIPK